ncbi:hypothetical protein Bbelb_343500 [Branchiostoma belcheri]|nr:hypothetical protein Bbelb_343500 [Branchiostoma belcheri]
MLSMTAAIHSRHSKMIGAKSKFDAKKGPSRQWWAYFKKRNGVLLRKPDPLDWGQKDAVDKATVDNFITLYQDLLKTHGLEKAPHRVYNADETGFTLDPQRKKIDQHSANVTPAAIEVALKHNIILIGFPPHSSHFIQPMDARGGPFASLESKFGDVVQNLNVAKPNFVVRKSSFPRIYRVVRDEGLTMAVMKRGFKNRGIFPVNPDRIDQK